MPQLRISSRGSARAAQTSQPRWPGDPSVIESPSAATTTRPSVLSGIALLRDQLRQTLVLLDDVVARATLDHLFEVGRLVTGKYGELLRVRADLLIFGTRHAD